MRNLEGQLPAQLTTAACLMRLCLAEFLQKEEQDTHLAKDDVGPYCSAALKGGWFGDAVRVLRVALQVVNLHQAKGCTCTTLRVLKHIICCCAFHMHYSVTEFQRLMQHSIWLQLLCCKHLLQSAQQSSPETIGA